MDLLHTIAASILSEVPWGAIIFALEVTFVLFDIILLIAIIDLFKKADNLRPRFEHFIGVRAVMVSYDPKVEAQWKRLKVNMKSAPPHSFALGVIDADKFVDEILRRDLRLGGEHMADRLEQLSIRDINPQMLERLWRAHKIRNELVHAPDFTLSEADAHEIMEIYEEFLRAIGVVKNV